MYNPAKFWNSKVDWFLSNLPIWEKMEQGKIQELDCICKEIQKVGAKKILEVGCGTGENLSWVSEHNPQIDLVGVDISLGIIKRAKSISSGGIKYIKGEVNFLPFKDREFDFVFTRVCLMHIPPDKIKGAIQELKRVSKSLLIIETVGNFQVDFCFNHSYRKIIRDLDYKWELVDRRALDDVFERVSLRIL